VAIHATRSPWSIESPILTGTLEIMPLHGAEIIVSIFIALKIAIGSPFYTV